MSNVPARAEPKRTTLEVVENRLLASMTSDRMKAIMANGLDPKRLVALVVQQARTNSRLMECFNSEAGQLSILESLSKAATLVLEPDGVQGALVPFKNKSGEMLAQFIPMYQGLIGLAARGGIYTRFSARSVHENDEFDIELGTSERIVHRPSLGERGRPIGYYFIAWPKDGGAPHFDFMSWDEVDRIKQRSRAKDFGPWVTDPDEMGKKTVARRALKVMAKDAETARILRDLDADEFEPAPAQVERPARVSGLQALTQRLATKASAEPEPANDDAAAVAMSPEESARIDREIAAEQGGEESAPEFFGKDLARAAKRKGSQVDPG